VVNELGLNEYLKRASYFGSNDLGRHEVKVAAESLEVGAEQKDVTAEILIDEARVRQNLRHACGTLGVDDVDAR
jgi:hypothetical protein